jgi:hypothetical protein
MKTQKQPKWITLQAASDIFKVSVPRLKELAKRGFIEWNVQTLAGVCVDRMFILRKSAEEYFEK